MTGLLLFLAGIIIAALIGLGRYVAVLADQVEALRVDLEHHTDPRTIMRKVEGIRRTTGRPSMAHPCRHDLEQRGGMR